MSTKHEHLLNKLHPAERKHNQLKDSAILDVIVEEYGSDLEQLSDGQKWNLIEDLAQDESDRHERIPSALAASVNRLSYNGRIKLIQKLTAQLDPE